MRGLLAWLRSPFRPKPKPRPGAWRDTTAAENDAYRARVNGEAAARRGARARVYNNLLTGRRRWLDRGDRP